MNNIQKYKLEKQIGAGSYSRIVKATRKEDNQQCAIKIMTKQQVKNSKRLNTPVVEKIALEKLKSNNIVKMIEYFEDSGSYYYVLELIEGKTLSDVKLQNELIQNNNIRSVIVKIVETLGYIHSEHIIHRDIKCDNIMICGDYEVKICDFGSCKVYDKENNFQRGSFVGTPNYLAPEIINEENQDYAIDLWSLGVVIYFIYYKKYPFDDIVKMNIYKKIKEGVFETTDKMDSDVNDLIKSLLKLNPADRLGYNDYTSGYSSILQHQYFKKQH